MKVQCKKDYYNFKKGNSYSANVHSVVEINDYITVWFSTQNNQRNGIRFSLRKVATWVEDYIGENEIYFYDYFCDLNEERRKKLKQLESC